MRNSFLSILSAALVCWVACGDPGQGPDKPETVSLSTPADVRLNRYTDHSLIFQWEAVSQAESYEWKLTQGSSEAKSGTTKNTTAIIDGLTKGMSYQFSVRALAGTSASGWSAQVTGIPGGELPPDPPTPPDPTPDTPVSDAVYQQFQIPSAEEGDKLARAFPGAEGGGMYVTGGRGGQVIHVTNTNDSGTGSLRAALSASGKRIVVFDVAGTIELQSTLEIKNGDLTIAGQTAPGDGICIKNYSTQIKKGANNIIIRFVRFRMGDEKKTEDDAIWGRYLDGIILDHCSMSWSTDECSSFYANEFFTMQWCILTESLTNSVHGKGSHGYGGIWGGKNASFHHNLLANHNNRTPRFDHPQIYENPANPARRGNVDYRNNVNYNWGSGNGCYGGEGAYINMVGNFYKPGPASADRHYYLEADGVYKASEKQADGTSKDVYYAYGFPHVYLQGNKHTKYPDISDDNTKGVYWKAINGNKGTDGKSISQDGCLLSTSLPINASNDKQACVTTHSADQAFEQICLYAGASLHRDAVDARAVTDASNGTASFNDGGNGSKGGLIDTQSAVGGWPNYQASSEQLARLKDTDGDGMPDWFEEQFGLNRDKDDAGVVWLDKNGRYTNLEMYLHYLVKDIVAGGNNGGTYTKL